MFEAPEEAVHCLAACRCEAPPRIGWRIPPERGTAPQSGAHLLVPTPIGAPCDRPPRWDADEGEAPLLGAPVCGLGLTASRRLPAVGSDKRLNKERPPPGPRIGHHPDPSLLGVGMSNVRLEGKRGC